MRSVTVIPAIPLPISLRDSYGLPGVGLGNSIGFRGPIIGGAWKSHWWWEGNENVFIILLWMGWKFPTAKPPKQHPKATKHTVFFSSFVFSQNFPFPNYQPTNQPTKNYTFPMTSPICGSPNQPLVFLSASQPPTHPSAVPCNSALKCSLKPRASVVGFFFQPFLLGNPPTMNLKEYPPRLGFMVLFKQSLLL